MEKISLIIPVYNAQSYLTTLLDSIVEQRYTNYEAIFVNDGSTDDSLDILKKYQKKYKNIKIITTINNGPGLARKKGFECCTGSLLFFLDSDDFLPDSLVLEKIAKIYEETNFELLLFDVILEHDKKIERKNFLENTTAKVGKNDIKFLENYEIDGTLWNKVFVKDKMKSQYFCDSFNFEDFYVTYNYLNQCASFYYIDEVFYYSNRNIESSLSKKYSLEKICDTVKILNEIYDSSKYKGAVSVTALKYYYWIKKLLKIDVGIRKQKKNVNNIFKDLDRVINLKYIFRLKLNLKLFIKIVYYILERKIFS